MFVTAFFPPKNPYRSADTYMRNFQSFAESGVPILLFLDPSCREWTFPPNVRVVITTLDTSWLPPDAQLPAHRNPVKDTAEYMCIQLSKLAYLTDARAYTTDPFLAWLDFGAFHMFKDHDACRHIIETLSTASLPTDRILAPGCWDAGTYDWNSVCWRFCGTFLIGHRDLVPAAYCRQMEIVRSQFPRLTWEVNIWAQMDELFHVYKANHDDTLLSRVMVFVHKHQGVAT
jgi:hypothetical protein